MSKGRRKAKRWDTASHSTQEYPLPGYCLYCGALRECVKALALISDMDTSFPFPMCWKCSDIFDSAAPEVQVAMARLMLDEAGRHMEREEARGQGGKARG